MENLEDIVPLAGTLGIQVTTAEPGEVRGGMDWAAERCTANGVLHGGALMAFADTLGGVCAFLNLPEGATSTATLESKTNSFVRFEKAEWKASRVRCTSGAPSSSSRRT